LKKKKSTDPYFQEGFDHYFEGGTSYCFEKLESLFRKRHTILSWRSCMSFWKRLWFFIL